MPRLEPLGRPRNYLAGEATTGRDGRVRLRDDSAEGVPQIVETEDVRGGDPRIEGTRIGVAHVYRRYVDGDDTPEEIATGYDIPVAAVHAALAYAFGNPRQMRDLEARDRLAYEEAGRLTPEDI